MAASAAQAAEQVALNAHITLRELKGMIDTVVEKNYRILTLYPTLIKNSPNDVKIKRDFEMKYAKIVCQSGYINLTQFHYLTEEDKILLSILEEEEYMREMTALCLRFEKDWIKSQTSFWKGT